MAGRPHRWALAGAATLLLLALAGAVVACVAHAPCTACGLLALVVFLLWFISCEGSHAHHSNETEDYVLFAVVLWTWGVLLYSPDSVFATVRGLWAAPAMFAMAFLCNVLSRSRHRQSLIRAGDVKKNWPRRVESDAGVSNAHVHARVEALKEALRPIDLNLVPTFFNSLVRFPMVLSCERTIYDIFEDSSLDKEELSSLVMEAPTSLLFYKVKDHTMLARIWRALEGVSSRRGPRRLTLPARTTHAFENRSNLVRLLCHARLPDLSLRARAIVVDGLQQVRLSSPVAERALENIMLKTFGSNLVVLKNLCDAKGTHQSLHRLIFCDVVTASVRKEILRHFRCQAGLVAHQLRQAGASRPVLRKVLSDVDDTFICSGGHWPAGIDGRMQKGSVYPGASAFMRQLDQSFGMWSESLNWTGGKKLGNIAFLSARPHVYKGFAEKKTLGHFAQLRDEGKIHCMPTMLCGSLDSGLKFMWKDELEPMAQKKFSNFAEYVQLYPEYTFVFVGDNGQGDLRAALLMLEDYCELVEAVFIHVVQPIKSTYGYSLFEKLEAAKRAKICFFQNYAEAATDAFERGLFSAEQLSEVLRGVRRDFQSLEPAAFPEPLARERMRREVNESGRAAVAAAGKRGAEGGDAPAFDPLEAVQEVPESTEVVTLYGPGTVRAFSPEDGVYTVKLSGWKATAHLHMTGVQLLPARRRFSFGKLRRSMGPREAPSRQPTPPQAPPASERAFPTLEPLDAASPGLEPEELRA